ncbi:peptide ABC transporter substrate-binding protein [Synoicihabitans lomoniglobus]|uniref:Peptide ABC transporter substrate-binding protein n=1 Tax=Synoicihabitans lomoniglobus TaxID=2909285 RepID=A0AAF0CR60_9BACT|nr:peptide ABC transporter substrate-binding protein [Opitutaceae bacterium LMO-M01]WED66543.1 peptide ABC transporter substrate-binding protein [Opitutaceae bacterium LMO-M01]
MPTDITPIHVHRRFWSGLALLVVVLIAVGCGKRETAVEAGIRTQTLHIGNRAEPPDLDPQTNNSLVVSFIHEALFEGLVRLANDGATIRPGVAERWEISPDGLRYTFHLRADAAWSNGDLITAPDFVASFERFMNPQLGCEAVNFTYPIVGARDFVEGRITDFGLVGVEATDASTLEIRLRFRAPYFLSVLADKHFVPLHRSSVERFDGWNRRGGAWTKPGNLISNGPFALTEWKPNVVVAVAKNPHYWNAPAVKLNEVHFHPIEDPGTEERAFRSGQLHVTFSLPSSKVAAYMERQAPELHAMPLLQTNFISFMTTRAPFDDARVRQAFSLAIDRDQLLATVLKGQGDVASTYVRSGSGGYELPPFSRYDPATARRLLAEAGYPGGAGFPRQEFTLSSRDEDKLIYAQALQEMWRQTLGVEVQMVPTEFKVWLDVLRNRSFALTTDGWNMTVNDPSEMLALGVTGDPNNDANWSNADYDAAFAAIEQATTDEARRDAIIMCERIIGEEVPYAPVYHSVRNFLLHPSVQGWRGNTLQVIDWTAVSLHE